MWLALASLATCSMLAVGLSRSSQLAVSRTHNRDVRVAAAADTRTALSVGLRELAFGEWPGVGHTSTLSVPTSAAAGTTVSVTFSGDLSTPPDPFTVHIAATATTAATTSQASSSLTATADQRIRPHVLPFGSASDDNLAPLPQELVELHPEAVAILNPPSSPAFPPNVRIDGGIRTLRPFDVVTGTAASATVQDALVASYGGVGANRPPHPIGGDVRTFVPPSATQVADLSALGVNTEAADPIGLPPFNESSYINYQIFQGGPVYASQTIGPSLSDTVLQPTTTNPLGIYYRNGEVEIGDDVTIVGTLLARDVRCNGKRISVASCDGRELAAAVGIAAADWPRLFAIGCEELTFSDNSQAMVDGTIVCASSCTRIGRVHRPTGTSVPLIAAATVERLPQPLCRLRFSADQDLSSVDATTHDLWIPHPRGGSLHAVRSVDKSAKTIDVVGEWGEGETVACQCLRRSQSRVAIRGRIVTASLNLTADPVWQMTSGRWASLHSNWETENAQRQAAGDAAIRFHDYIAAPINHQFGTIWDFFTYFDQMVYGLPSDPTFLVRSSADRPSWRLPLFVPGTIGYRCETVAGPTYPSL